MWIVRIMIVELSELLLLFDWLVRVTLLALAVDNTADD